jgi:Flp pilus assembly protein TadD
MQTMLAGVAILSGCLLSVPVAAQDWDANSELSSNRLSSPGKPSQAVSADFLRHPISSKTRRMLQRAVDLMRSGEHQEAIRQLEDTLLKDPSSAAYVQSLLGFEYLKTDQFAAAVNSFEQAVILLPHDASNHQNFAISLAGIGDYKRAEQEVRRAQELAPESPEIRHFLDALLAFERSRQPVIVADAP